MSEMMLGIFSSHVWLIRRKFAFSPLNVLSSVCSTSVSKHQFDFLWYLGQNGAKFTAKRHCSESVDVEDQGGLFILFFLFIYLANTKKSKQLSRQNQNGGRVKTVTFPLSLIFVFFCALCQDSRGGRSHMKRFGMLWSHLGCL